VVSPLENWTKVVMELNDNAINRHKNVHAGTTVLLPLSCILGLFRIVIGRGRTAGTIGISLGTSEAEANRSNRFCRKSRYSSSLPEIMRIENK